ncbi:MAG: sigma 54-interacting transcriptional regulator, partial [Firmicutes bacterium]|nr:sigma 54-interacting transcriptional regulator [Bacillota bacterium]
MNTYRPLFQQVIDDIDQGIIYINHARRFQHINKKAKEILGITVDKSKSHPAGHINPGDIVKLANNSIGYDDGSLTPEDLALINIRDKNIRLNDMFVGAGIYRNQGIDAVYKHLPNNHLADSLVLKTSYLSYQLEASVSNAEKKLSIVVNGISYELAFMKGSGHMVIIDGLTGKVKFFQAKGYTVRGEDLRHILMGTSYLAKGADIQDMDIVGQNIETILDGELKRRILSALDGETELPAANSEIFYINKIIALCSIRPVKLEGKIDGVILKMIDSSEMEALLQIRNRTIEEMEQVYADFQTSSPDYPDRFLENVVGSSNVIQKIKALAYKATRTNSNIIITGESGTGKSQLAYEIHKICRPGKPFVEVNCSAIPPSLFESELFGYVGGAFTGALSKGKAGYFEMAGGGTIFLDEIG